MTNKILLLAYYWPPSGGAGVQRWLKLSHYLAEMGVEVHVLTVDPAVASYPQRDESLLADVHPAVNVHTSDSFEPLGWYARIVGKDKLPSGGFAGTNTSSWKQRAIMRLRTHLFLPDPRIGWKRYAVRRAKEIIAEFDVATVITTGPPASVHMIGRALRRQLAVRWIADFRDPWTDIYYYDLLLHSRWSHARNTRLERSVLLEADHVVTVSEGFRALLAAHVPERPEETMTIIPNGYDPRDFATQIALPPTDGFTIGYTGTMSDQYDPTACFEAIATVIRQRPAANIRLEVAGTLSASIQAQLDQLGIPVVALGMVPHDRVTSYQRRADLLLLVVPDTSGAKGIFPAKVFEYLAAGPPILSLGAPDAEVGRAVVRTGRGQHFGRTQANDIAAYLLAAVDGSLALVPDVDVVQSYSRAHQAALFRELF